MSAKCADLPDQPQTNWPAIDNLRCWCRLAENRHKSLLLCKLSFLAAFFAGFAELAAAVVFKLALTARSCFDSKFEPLEPG